MSQSRQGQTDSLDDRVQDEPEVKQKSRRPPNTAFRQQRLKAWQPILTPKTVLPLFFIIGIVFAPIGGLLLYASAQVEEIVIDYTHCIDEASSGNRTDPKADFKPIPDKYFKIFFKDSTPTGETPTWLKSTQNVSYMNGLPAAPGDDLSKAVNLTEDVCSLQFQIPDAIGPPVFLYYRLTNFFQNHRRYVKSYDMDQLKGDDLSASAISGGTCSPLTLCDQDDKCKGKPFYPCGIIANSMFNDTFQSPQSLTQGNDRVEYFMSRDDIAWSSDKKLYGKTKYKPEDIAIPPYWQKRWNSTVYSEDNGPPDLQNYPAFQVWMRTAGLPDFAKLALRNDSQKLEAGRYQLDINSNFNVSKYGGTKSIVITTSTVMGGKNPFLGIAYVVVGGICVLLGLLFTAAHLIKPRKLGDHTHLSWNNEQRSTATTTAVSRPNEGA